MVFGRPLRISKQNYTRFLDARASCCPMDHHPEPLIQMSFIGMRTIIYHVSDLDAAKRWYTLATGVEPYFDEPYYVGYNIGGFELGLDPSVNNGKSGTGGTTAYWGVANVEDAVANLVSVGATLESPATDVGEGILVATVIDPFGNELGVIENPYFKLEDVR